jgi:hypothetical protein
MTARRTVVRWESTADPSLCGVEIAGRALRAPAPSDTSRVSNPSFVITAIGSSRPSDIATAVLNASAAYGNARACVALDAGALFAMDLGFLRENDISVVLDNVDEKTPLSAVTVERVDAVRFEPSFVARARTDGRLACVLQAMLGLAHDLGIATLGTASGRGKRTDKFEFDYVSSPTG